MLIDASFAELHNPLFLAGTNLTVKLDITKRSGLQLKYDLDKDRLIVIWNGKVAIVPGSNVSSATPVRPDELGIKLESEYVLPTSNVRTAGPAPMVSNVSATAQVETPHGKVQNPPLPSKFKQ